MKNIVFVAVVLMTAAGLAACAGGGTDSEAGTSASPSSLTIQSLNASKSPISLEVPYNP